MTMTSNNDSPMVHMQQGLVAHEEGPHDLEGRDLQGEIEGLAAIRTCIASVRVLVVED